MNTGFLSSTIFLFRKLFLRRPSHLLNIIVTNCESLEDFGGFESLQNLHVCTIAKIE